MTDHWARHIQSVVMIPNKRNIMIRFCVTTTNNNNIVGLTLSRSTLDRRFALITDEKNDNKKKGNKTFSRSDIKGSISIISFYYAKM